MASSLYDLFKKSTGVSTDSRAIGKGNLFFALKGPNFNGNEFAAEAIEKGASWVILDEPSFKTDPRHVIVENSLSALQELAAFHRRKFSIPVIGITGTNGKTTTKELITAVLSSRFRTVATSGNLNNHIGVPLTLLKITHETEMAVIEMGANKPGDIRELCDIADPDHGIITSIGKAHIEGFGSLEGVIRTKSELYDHLMRHNGKVFINSKNELLAGLGNKFSDPVFYPGKNDFFHCELLKADPFITYRNESGGEIVTRLIGSYNFYNMAAALCVGKYFGVDPRKANEAISSYAPANMRSQVLKVRSNTVILDAYNANPPSMAAALDTLQNMSSKHRVAILGDMFELGAISDEEHANIGRLTLKSGLDEIYFCGERMYLAHTANPKSLYFKNKSALEDFLRGKKFHESTILIKASRGMQLESIVNQIQSS